MKLSWSFLTALTTTMYMASITSSYAEPPTPLATALPELPKEFIIGCGLPEAPWSREGCVVTEYCKRLSSCVASATNRTGTPGRGDSRSGDSQIAASQMVANALLDQCMKKWIK